MSVAINKIDDRNYTVNGKSIYKDANQNWVAPVELTTKEKKTFTDHLKKVESN